MVEWVFTAQEASGESHFGTWASLSWSVETLRASEISCEVAPVGMEWIRNMNQQLFGQMNVS